MTSNPFVVPVYIGSKKFDPKQALDHEALRLYKKYQGCQTERRTAKVQVDDADSQWKQ